VATVSVVAAIVDIIVAIVIGIACGVANVATNRHLSNVRRPLQGPRAVYESRTYISISENALALASVSDAMGL